MGSLLCCLWSFFWFGVRRWQPWARTFWFSHDPPRDSLFSVTNWSIWEKFWNHSRWQRPELEIKRKQDFLLNNSFGWLLGWSDTARSWPDQSILLVRIDARPAFPMKVRKSFFCLGGTLEHETWLIACWQVSKQSPLICHLVHILTWLFQSGWLLVHFALKSFHFSPTNNKNLLHCWSFITQEPASSWSMILFFPCLSSSGQVHLCRPDHLCRHRCRQCLRD